MNQTTIKSELKLPCGAVLKNRIGKSAMSENMGTLDHRANEKFISLYSRWAKGGAGLLITGNVMIDRKALGEPRNVVIQKNHPDPHLARWAQAGSLNGTHHWVQLNHPGKQSPKFLSPQPVSPSAVSIHGPLSRYFNQPKALLEPEIYEIIGRFGNAAKAVKEAGFTGVQIHGAHGYLVSQFLSPLHNIRTDQWGGSLQNRMRFVNLVYRAIREMVGPEFPVGIKLNSADFQKGGFSEEESMEVVEFLSNQGMDLIEISGGTYEAPEMTGVTRKDVKKSTQLREAYFLEYCEKVRKKVKTPLMLTGGFRSLGGMSAALDSNSCDMIGLARALAIDPDFPNQILSGQDVKSSVEFLTTGFKVLDDLFPLEITWYTQQIHRMGNGKMPKSNLSPLSTVMRTLLDLGLSGLRRVRS